jgi:hypothetical protein
MLIGLIIGVVSGAVQFLMLGRFTGSVTGGSFNKKTALFAAAQFFLPLVILLGCALFLRESLLWAAVGMTVALVSCSVVRFFVSNAARKR